MYFQWRPVTHIIITLAIFCRCMRNTLKMHSWELDHHQQGWSMVKEQVCGHRRCTTPRPGMTRAKERVWKRYRAFTSVYGSACTTAARIPSNANAVVPVSCTVYPRPCLPKTYQQPHEHQDAGLHQHASSKNLHREAEITLKVSLCIFVPTCTS